MLLPSSISTSRSPPPSAVVACWMGESAQQPPPPPPPLLLPGQEEAEEEEEEEEECVELDGLWPAEEKKSSPAADGDSPLSWTGGSERRRWPAGKMAKSSRLDAGREGESSAFKNKDVGGGVLAEHSEKKRPRPLSSPFSQAWKSLSKLSGVERSMSGATGGGGEGDGLAKDADDSCPTASSACCPCCADAGLSVVSGSDLTWRRSAAAQKEGGEVEEGWAERWAATEEQSVGAGLAAEERSIKDQPDCWEENGKLEY